MANRTLIATLVGRTRLMPPFMTTITIGGEAVHDVNRLSLDLSADVFGPATVELRRLVIQDGEPVYVSEIRDIRNMILTVEYQED